MIEINKRRLVILFSFLIPTFMLLSQLFKQLAAIFWIGSFLLSLLALALAASEQNQLQNSRVSKTNSLILVSVLIMIVVAIFTILFLAFSH